MYRYMYVCVLFGEHLITIHACTYIHTYIHTYIQMPWLFPRFPKSSMTIHEYTHHIHAYIHACIHTCMHTYMHTYIHTDETAIHTISKVAYDHT